MSDFIKEYWEKITANKVLSAFIVLVMAVFIVGWISISRYSNPQFLEGILIEAHGMILDIFIIGVFILWLNRIGERRMEVQRYKNEIDDFRNWESAEAKYRIVGNIKRLNRLNISAIDLSYCTLHNAKLNGVMLQGANLSFAELQGAELQNANLQGANLAYAKLQDVDLVMAEFQSANLQSTNFREAILKGANLEGADLKDTNFCETDLTNAHFNLAQIEKVKTLFKAIIDAELKKQIEEKHHQLLTKPGWLEVKDA